MPMLICHVDIVPPISTPYLYRSNIPMLKKYSRVLLASLLGFSAGLIAFTAQAQSIDGPVVEPIQSNTAAAIESFYTQNGGRSEFPQITQDVIQAVMTAEDLVTAGDFAGARTIVDEFIAQYPFSDGAWSGATFPSGLNLGRPAGHASMRMLDEITRQGLANQGKESLPLTMTIVTSDCAVGFQPTTPERTDRIPVSHTLDPLIEANNHRVMRQGAQLFQQYIHAITDGERHLQLQFIPQNEICTIVNSPTTGRWIGANNTTEMLDELPEHVKESTDIYWFVYPSNIPETPIFEGFELISSATNRYQDRMVFMMDDRWILKKPLHLGTGTTSEVERRLYHPQWMQHEYFHHLFLSEFSEFRLEATSHSWFNLANWPEDFERPPSREADYYSEAVNKRFYGASPSAAERLTYSDFDSKAVRIYAGSNFSGAAWSIDPGTTSFGILSNSPVGNDRMSSIEIPPGFRVKLCVDSGGRGTCQTYTRSVAQLEPPMNNAVSHIEVEEIDVTEILLAGNYVRSPILNRWHLVDIVQENDEIWWTNNAGISCPLSWVGGRLMADPSCPYGEREIGVLQGLDGNVTAIRINGEIYDYRGPSTRIDGGRLEITSGVALAKAVGFDTDSDQDGVPDILELVEKTDPADAQSFLDSDNDGLSDNIDTDTDGDGISNINESGVFPYYDRDQDGVPAYLDDNDYDNRVGDNNNRVEPLYDPNGDGTAAFRDSATTSLADRDGDQVPDSVEILNGTNPSDATDFPDHDRDRIPDYIDSDDDNDGIADVVEGSSDADADGIANMFDTDSDGDGVSDADEGMADIDGNALPNFLDSNTQSTVPANDQDSDGIADEVEGTVDSDQDGIANLEDEDSDNDGISDLIETNADLDGDGIPNYLDDDSDGDSISDQEEGATDEDGDSRANFLDHNDENTDANGNSDQVQSGLTDTSGGSSGGGVIGQQLVLLLIVSLLLTWRRHRMTKA